jgi:hypothetical protein
MMGGQEVPGGYPAFLIKFVLLWADVGFCKNSFHLFWSLVSLFEEINLFFSK